MIKLCWKKKVMERPGEQKQTLLCPPLPWFLSLHTSPYWCPVSPLKALPSIYQQSMLATETLSEGWRDVGREEERVMVRISIPQCWSALLQSLRGMGLGMQNGRGERERERESLCWGWGGEMQGRREVRVCDREREGTAWQLNPPRPVY